ncbi:MAG: S41 family peptidase [Campylobacteraceae bacterium]|jgi:carboxyl-terminal processing protease|nr:S41 family peptidase [Campylobacteraceae bacterium]
MKNLKPFIFGFFATLITISVFAGSLLADNAADNNNSSVKTKSRIESFTKYYKVLEIVEGIYVDDLTLEEIIKKSIEGLLTNLDAHSGYINEKSFQDLKTQMEGEFGGLGITIGMKDGAVTIIAPIEDTPADKAGLKAGDVILKIDNRSTIDMTLDEAVSLMRGEPKTAVKITIVRKGENRPLVFDIVRDMIKVDSVYTKVIEGENILYIRVTNFDQNVANKTAEALKKQKNLKGVILDMRNNPGGLLDQAVELTDIFVDSGTIVSQKGRNSANDRVYKAKKGVLTTAPMVVLVNGGSASASEIVSGALQDLKRAVIVGENTFGKGSVQQIIPINDNQTEAVKLTIARYYLPSGRTIQTVGVEPDVIVHAAAVPSSDNDFSIKESDLKKHLEGELTKIDNSTKSAAAIPVIQKKEAVISQGDILKDLQLKSAVDIIKVLNITTKK